RHIKQRQRRIPHDEIIERDGIAPLGPASERVDKLRIGERVFQHFQHHPRRRQDQRRLLLQEEAPGHVQEGVMLAVQFLETNRSKRVEDDLGCGGVTVEHGGCGSVGASRQQLVTKDVQITVKNRLSGNENVVHDRPWLDAGAGFPDRSAYITADRPTPLTCPPSRAPIDGNGWYKSYACSITSVRCLHNGACRV